MRYLKFKSLTMRIWTTFTAIILIIVCSISFLYLVAYRRINENARMQDLKVAHDMVLSGNNFAEANRFDEMRNLKGSDHFIAKITDNNRTQITDMNKDMNKRQGPPPQGGSQGSILQGNQQNQQHMPVVNDTATRLWMASFAKGTSVYEQEFKETYNNVRFLFIISSVEDTSGRSYLISYMPDINDNRLVYAAIIIGAVFIAIGFVTAKMVANYISKPLKELEDYTVRIAHKDWKEPLQVKSEDEIGRLVNSMNRMQTELRHADEEEKMFLQSISHDLKTPVMVIMSHADAIIDGVYVENVEKTAEIIKDEAINLEKKIKQLLYLNTLDYVLQNNSDNEEIKLQDLLQHIIGRFEVINSKIEWNLNLHNISINGNLDKIKVSIENILDNSLRYAKEEIRVSLKKENSFAVLEMYNDGPNIKSEHIGHIFDNLYKDKTGNFGLGLAISKKIVDFYRGEIEAVNREEGVSFIIKYPVYEK